MAVPYLRIVVSQASGEAGLAKRVAVAASVAFGLGLNSEQVTALREIDAEYFDKPEQIYRDLTDKALTAFTPVQQEKLWAEVDRRGW